ncbi:MAG: ABC transporter substrate-binding protein [Firmicutes bacterium]|nr:ABC transporter substrate-binding protein [Bacillota bacterium]
MKKSGAVLALLLLVLLTGCTPRQTEPAGLQRLQKEGSMKLLYADQFSVEYYEGGYKLLTVAGEDRFLVVPAAKTAPEGLDSDIAVLQQPIEDLYLAATASMCLFDALDGMESIRFSGTRAQDWYIENARTAMEEGSIVFAGKYSEPDYEMLLAGGCPAAIESTMINHASDVAEKLTELGIAVIIDHSGYESHPLGRTEWIRFYGALLDKEEQADALFQEQVRLMEQVMEEEPTGRTVAFFTITSAGKVVARKSSDYISRMIAIAGGEYIFSDLGDPASATGTQTIEMETFFKTARDADYIIYNSTLTGGVASLAQLLEKAPLLKDLKAVKEGNVWCTEQNMFQESTCLGEMIRSFRMIFSGQADHMTELSYLYRLQ